MSLEDAKPSNERRRAGTLEVVALATTLLGAVDQRPAEALEVAPETSWNVAITKNIRDAVLHEKNERFVVFTRFKDGSFAWPSVVNSDSPNMMTYSTKGEMQYMLKNHKGRSFEIRCSIHTHPLYYLENPSGDRITAPYNPPNYIDASPENAQVSAKIKSEYQRLKLPLKEDIYAVADASGVWYYTLSPEAKISPGAQEEWLKVFYAFNTKSFTEKDFNFTKEYSILQQAYRTHLKVDVRFVPYSEIEKEPPCAGVGYTPKNK